MEFDRKDISKVLASAIAASALAFFLMNDYGIGALGFLVFLAAFAAVFFCLKRLGPIAPAGLREHLPYVLAIILLATLYCHAYFSLKLLVNVDYEVGDFPDIVKYSHPFVKVMRDAYLSGEFPLWSPWTWGGYPFQATPDKPALYPFLIVFLLLPTTYGALNAAIIFHIILAGLAMYALVWRLEKTKEGALFAGVCYMLSGIFVSMLDVGGLPYLMAPAWAPLAFLFAYEAVATDAWVRNALLAAFSFAMMFHAGGIQYFQYVGIMVGLYYAYHLALHPSKKTLKRMALVGLLLGAVLGGLIAAKLLPNLDYVGLTNRAQAMEKSEWPGALGGWHALRYFLVTPLTERFGDAGAHIGVLGFLLMLYALPTIKRKKTLFMVLAMALAISLASASFVYQLFWKYVPGISQGIYLQRFLLIYTLAAAFLAGVGTKRLLERIGKRRTAVLVLLVALAFAELTFITYKHSPSEDLGANIADNKALGYIKGQAGLFRVHSLQTGGIDTTTSPYTVPMGLYELYGFDGSMWMTQYMNEFLSVCIREPDKLWGLMNVRYLFSTEPVNHSSFRLVDKFPECKSCLPERMDGPYVYENEKWLPRAFSVKHQVLVMGEGDPALNWMYTLLLTSYLDPAYSAVVLGDKPQVTDYSQDYLKKFDAVFLANVRVDSAALNALTIYAAGGGRVYPNVLNGKSTITEEDVKTLFGSFAEKYSDVKVKEYGPNKIVVEAGAGLLLLGEKFYMFPAGWRAAFNGQPLNIERTDGGLSSVYLPAGGTVVFEYYPDDFGTGLKITLLTLILLAAYAARGGLASLAKNIKMRTGKNAQ